MPTTTQSTEPTDVLSDVLRSLRAAGTVYFCDQLAAPWEKVFADTTAASFHQIRRGSCVVQSGDVQELLEAGDLVFLAPGHDHILSSAGAAESRVLAEPATLLLCGYCEFDTRSMAPLADLFPPLRIIRNQELLTHPGLYGILNQLSVEYLSMQPGARLVVERLTEILVVELIRMNFGRSERLGLLRALADKPVAAALQRLHGQPENPWTLESLSSEIGMSRAAFAKRFRELVGLPMFDYLTGVRIQRACELLRDTSLPLYEIASRVGYDSDLSFTRTFKKRTGETPTAWRKSATTQLDQAPDRQRPV